MIEVWIDGCCYPVNPGGTACAGYVIKKKGLTIAKGSKIIGKGKGMTNNVAEYQALITALQEIKKRQLYTEEITIKSDSTLLVNQMNGNWKVKSQLLYPLYREAKKLVAKYDLKIKWIPRELNEEADEMSRVAFKTHILKDNSQKDEQLEKEAIKDLFTFQSFSIEEQAKENNKSKESISSKEQSKTNRMGETENLIVDSDPSQEMLLLYGKEISDDIPFKLGIKKEEITTVIELLSKGKTFLDT
jgi:ribonuclease HI